MVLAAAQIGALPACLSVGEAAPGFHGAGRRFSFAVCGTMLEIQRGPTSPQRKEAHMAFLFLGSLHEGIKSLDRGQLGMACGCHYDGSVPGYALVTCPQNHFSQYCDRKLLVEHRATHKRRRKSCKFCNGTPA